MSKCHTKDSKRKRKVSTVTEENKDFITLPVTAALNEHDPKTKWATVCLQNSEIFPTMWTSYPRQHKSFVDMVQNVKVSKYQFLDLFSV